MRHPASLKRRPGSAPDLPTPSFWPYWQSGRLAAEVVEPDIPDELPLRPADPLVLEGDELLPEPEVLEPALPDEVPPAIEPPLVEPEPVEPEPLEPKPLAPVPEVDEPVFEAVLKRGSPVVLSLQCVAADTFAPLADGEVEDEVLD